MKKNNTLKVLLITILFAVLITWLLPITYFNGGLLTDVRYPAGLFDIFSYPLITLYYFGQTAIYLLIVGAFYAIFNKTGVFKKVCDKVVKLFKGKEIIFFATIVTLLSIVVAFCGFGYELIFVLPLLAAIIILLGYDRITVAMTLIGSIAVGYAGSLFASSIAGTYVDTLSTNYTDLILFKIILLVLGIALLIFSIIRYIKKLDSKDIKKDEISKELLPESVEIKNKKGKVKPSWPAIVIFDFVLLLMIVSTLNYSGAFKIDIFETFHQNVLNVNIKDFKILANILGATSLEQASLGNWTSAEFMVIMLMATIVLKFIYRIKLDDMFVSYKEGAKKFALSALLVIVAYVVLITTSNHPVVLTILKPLLEITNGFNSVTTSLSMFITSIFNIDAYYIVSSTLPYLMSIVTDTSVYPLIAFISQTMQGLALLISPTSIVLLAIIGYLKVDYTKWVKVIWKFLLAFFILAFILFTIILVI